MLGQSPYQEVPDLIQDVFLTAWTRLTTLRDGRLFGSWVAAIARKSGPRHRRRHVALVEIGDVAGTGAPAAEALEALRAIAALPEAYRETLLLRYVEGMTGPEIALRTGLAEGSVRVNLHRGMKLLRERLHVSAGDGEQS